ncbi:MAG TPA: Gfo/Idh/MocA family oxidoreductase [Aggregatilineaceae bacterium]|nr:Gfo/Idh/MocA family oxidoreductase [Aggregatilineaceae bacterium]
MTILRVGVIGVGRMGERHCRVYSTLRNAHLVGVCDASLNLGNRVAQQYEVPFYANVDELLDRVDAVTLATPTPQHFDLALRCLEHGVHVLVEKPFTETVEQAEKLTQAAEASNRVVQVGHIERFNPTYIELKKLLENLTPLAVTWRRLSPYAGSNTDVDVILDLMVHDIDLALDLMGGHEPVSVCAHGLTARSGVADHVVVHLRFEDGPLVTLTSSRVTEQKVRMIEVTAQEAFVEGDLLNKSISVHRRTTGEYLGNSKYRQESTIERLQVPMSEPLFLELQHFAQCILEGKPQQVPARQGWRVLHLADAIRQECQENFLTLGAARARAS